MNVSINYHGNAKTRAKVKVMADSVWIEFNEGHKYGDITIFGPHSAADAFEKMADLFNKAMEEGKFDA